MNTNNMLYTIGGPETEAGTAVARTAAIPIRDRPTFRDQAEKIVDPAIVGNNMAVGEYLAAQNLQGDFQLSPRPCAGFGMMLNSLMGQESTPDQVGALIRIRYSGSETSAKISASATGDTLTSEVGAVGAEAGDANFGTSGVLSMADAATDIVSEVVAVVDAYTDYECELVSGDGTTDAGLILNITEWQAKGRWAYVFFGSSTSGLYRHQWSVVLSNTERPVYSVQGDGIHDNFLGTGVVVDQLSLSGALKAFLEADATALGFTWTAGQTASTVELESVDPFRFYDGSFSVNGVTQAFIRNLSLNATNNHNADGYGMGSVSRQYQQKGMFDVTGSMTIRYSANTYALYAKVFDNTLCGMDVYFKTPSVIAESLHGILLVEAPYISISDYEATDNNGVLDADMNYRVLNPSAGYGSPFRITMITDDSGTY